MQGRLLLATIVDALANYDEVIALVDPITPSDASLSGVRRGMQPIKGMDFAQCLTVGLGPGGDEPGRPGRGIFVYSMRITAWVKEVRVDVQSAPDLDCLDLIEVVVDFLNVRPKDRSSDCKLFDWCTDTSLMIYKSHFDGYQGAPAEYSEEFKAWRSDALFLMTVAACSYATPAAGCS